MHIFVSYPLSLPSSQQTNTQCPCFISIAVMCTTDIYSAAALIYTLLSFLGRLNVRVEYIPGSKHKVIMYNGDLCVNEELVARKMAIRQRAAGWFSHLLFIYIVQIFLLLCILVSALHNFIVYKRSFNSVLKPKSRFTVKLGLHCTILCRVCWIARESASVNTVVRE